MTLLFALLAIVLAAAAVPVGLLASTVWGTSSWQASAAVYACLTGAVAAVIGACV